MLARQNGSGTRTVDGKPVLWLLIKFEMRNITRYEVLSSDKISANGSTVFRLGATVHVRRNNVNYPVVIETISDDLEVIQNELNSLNPTTDGAAKPTFGYVHNTPSSDIDRSYRPMTFDQQTQSECRDDEMNLELMISQHSKMMQSQKMAGIQQQITALADDMNELRSLLMMFRGRISEQNHVRPSVILHSATVPEPTPRILNFSQQSRPPSVDSNSLTIDQDVDTCRDSNYSPESCSSNEQTHYQLKVTPMAHQSVTSAASTKNKKRKYSELSSSSPSSDDSCGAGSIYAISSNANNVHKDDIGDADDKVVLGDNNTTVSRSLLQKINWNSHTQATRALLLSQFDRQILATHSLTGKQSPGKKTTIVFNEHFSSNNLCEMDFNVFHLLLFIPFSIHWIQKTNQT